LVKAEVDRVPESQKFLERRAFREVDLDNIYLRCNTDVLTSDSSPTAIAPIIVDNVLQTFAGSGIEAPASLQQNLQQNYDPRGTLSCSKEKGSFKCWCIISSAALPRTASGQAASSKSLSQASLVRLEIDPDSGKLLRTSKLWLSSKAAQALSGIRFALTSSC
jgi:hypothetical protein